MPSKWTERLVTRQNCARHNHPLRSFHSLRPERTTSICCPHVACGVPHDGAATSTRLSFDATSAVPFCTSRFQLSACKGVACLTDVPELLFLDIADLVLCSAQVRARVNISVPRHDHKPFPHGTSLHTAQCKLCGRQTVEQVRKGTIYRQQRIRKQRLQTAQLFS